MIIRDVTDSKIAELALKSRTEELEITKLQLEKHANNLERLVEERSKQVTIERERFFSMLENLPVMVCLITADYHVPFSNRMFREKFGESKGRHCYEYIGCANEPCKQCESLIPLQTGKPHHWTANFPDGTVVDAHDYPFTDVDGTKMVLEADVDITERINLQKQLQEKERLAAIGATARMVGHDIRNPLQSITSDTYLLKDIITEMPENLTKKEAIESIESIENSILYINKIVADLQDFARPLKPEYSTVLFYELVTSIFHGIAISDNISVSIDVEPEIKFRSEATFLRRILSNLVINAVQAMPNGGQLTFSGCKHNDKILIFIEDTGSGIPEEIKSKLFTPMVTTKSKGQGLGLAVVKRLVDALNGGINVESEIGKGTKFTIELPNIP